ncbi:LysE family translocator [Intestinirhabdus alba]|jgi:homoserine/homoserine lactone efflux protein|uniref:LysE family translocator n=1 Tax=Intestinirhabdus alba TaxID=2899544 RepID=A0A6L6IIQ8_9ENTR|nr:LysE family translocator [Intestinirhabdus alba]MTH46721.1 LysE family translocator [Intestinirhabdus alba]
MTHTLLIYSLASLAVTVIPGPTVLLALANGTTRSLRTIASGMLGAACSDIILIAAVALGLGAVMAASEMLFSLIKWLGTAYLLWLAISLLRAKVTSDISVEEAGAAHNGWSGKAAFVRSLLTALSNPKGLLFFGAFLPQFLDLSQPSAPQYVLFAASSVLINIVVMACYAAAGYNVARFLSARYMRWMNRLSAAALAGMAAGLALYRRQA